MKLFGRSSGYYLFWTAFVYFWVGMYLAFTQVARPEFATLGFVLVLSVPLWCPPVARHFNMEPLMFDWFKDKSAKEYMDDSKYNGKVVPFPRPEAVPYIEPPKEPEKPAVTYYRLGLTDNNRVSFQMGYGEITMNASGINNMIAQLECFRDMLQTEDND